MSKIDRNWENSNTKAQVLQYFKNGERLHNFGILEKPALAPPYSQYEELSFKLALIGNSFSGKTSFLESLFRARPTTLLSNEAHPSLDYIETPGIQVNHFYWPIKFVNSRFLIFNLSIWDVGKSSIYKYDYIESSVYKENLDCRLYIFSWTDKKSFLDVYDDIKRIYFSNLFDQKKLPMLVIGTKFDQITRSEIEPELISEFENLVKRKVIRYSSLEATFDQISSLMNQICELLWDYRQLSNIR